MDKTALLILFSDGSLAVPEAKTLGDFFALCDTVARLRAEVEERVRQQPLAAILPPPAAPVPPAAGA